MTDGPLNGLNLVNLVSCNNVVFCKFRGDSLGNPRNLSRIGNDEKHMDDSGDQSN